MMKLFHYSRTKHMYYDNGQVGDFEYHISILCIGPWQWRWYS